MLHAYQSFSPTAKNSLASVINRAIWDASLGIFSLYVLCRILIDKIWIAGIAGCTDDEKIGGNRARATSGVDSELCVMHV